MTISIKHKFVNPKSDTADTTVSRASNWNDEHDITLAQNRVLGRISAANGPVEELTGEQIRTISETAQSGVLAGVNTRTASYTLVASDRGKIIEMNTAGANTVTVPNGTGIGGVNYPIGTQITVVQIGLGQTTVTPALGVSLLALEGGSKTTTRYSGVFLYKRGSNDWIALDQPYANASASAAAVSATEAAGSAALAGDRADDIAALASFRDYANLATLRANTSLTYTAGQPLTVVPNEIIRTRTEGYAYKVAASSATDHHVSTAGGIKLYAVAGQSGYDVKAFGAVGNGETEDTAAIQAAINSFALVGGYNSANVTGVTITLNGTFLTGPLTFPVNTPYRLEVSGGIKLTAGTTLTIPPEVTIYGKSGSLTSQFSFQSPGCLIVGSETSNPVVSVTNARGKCLENVVIAPPKFVGLLISGFSTLNALCKLKNVSCTARAGIITSKPFVAETTFWLSMEDCSFMGLVGSSPYSMEFLQSASSTSGSYNGLIYAHNLNVNSGGIYIQSSNNTFSSNFKFENLQIENIVPGGSLVTIDNTGTSFISDITLIRPQLFDNIGSTAYLINNIGNSNVRRINIQEFDLNQGAIINPTSTNVSGIVVDGVRGFPYGFEISGLPALDSLYTRSFCGAMDTILTTANRTATTVPVTPLLVEQSPTQWGALASGGATVTTGILAPDGSLNAGQVGGTNGGLITLYGLATSVALNDWFIVGYWAQSAEASKMPTNARLDLATGGWYVNGTTSTAAEIGRDYEPFAVGDQGWKWVCEPVKITTAGTGSPFVRLYLRRDTTYGLTNYFMPGVIHIPASLGFKDAEVVALSRSLQAWPSGSVSGDLAVLPHQTLRLGGGVGVFSASAIPTTGTWKRGDVVWNTTPSAGGVPGWVCVAAGTPGTWRAMANLAAV